ncbi:kinetochore complex Sim4 subunit Fta1-domain-containing protein [Hypoxylon sp. FL1284]|nr:kinetochore complex Sim4 subunit Fta1-domain-containing protein [Hypoxylon sp. FL1284]
MPPRRRKRAEAPASPSPAPEPSPRSRSDDASSSPGGSSYDEGEPPRFYNTTFTTYRVSPLYLGSDGALTAERLQTLARRLRDALVGDVVRGVQVGLVDGGDGSALGRTGALEAVEWRWVGAARVLGGRGDATRASSVELGGRQDDDDDDDEARDRGQRVLCVELRYENARFSALLVPDLAGGRRSAAEAGSKAPWTWQVNGDGNGGGEVDPSSFLHLPLLLFRMPAPLKSVLIGFLSSTFDCRISPLAIGTRTLVGSWEAWLSDARQAVGRDALFTLGFHIEPEQPKAAEIDDDNKNSGGDGDNTSSQPAAPPKPGPQGLKTIDVAVPALDVRRFQRAGEALSARTSSSKRKAGAATVLSDDQQARRRRKLAGGRDEEGWAWREAGGRRGEEAIGQPFTEALAAYVWHHLGLDMFHPGVRVQRVACDAFALSDGRLKVFAPAAADAGDAPAAAWRLLRDLARRARGIPGWGSGATAMEAVV